MSTLALWREKLGYQPLSLGIIAMITSAALAFGNRAGERAKHRDFLRARRSQILRQERPPLVVE